MFVASHIASEQQAVAAELPQIIGSIHTAIGRGTLRRAGAATEVKAGDPVREGDVIETAPDGLIAIDLLDGARFVLSQGTRVILDGLVCDSGSVSPLELFALEKGLSAFDRMARTGSPIENLRSRAITGGFGMLSLTALTFATISDARAADPDATFLDDDNIAYKDFEHGAFELWTKEAVPRQILVEDPGETIVLTKKGSSVSVSAFANSAARMEELQAAQQAVLSNYAKGYGPGGSSTPNFLDLPKPQPINFVPPGGTTTQGVLPALPEGPRPTIEPFITPVVVPEPPTLNTAIGPTLIDTSTLDHFAASGGRFLANSQGGATLTFGIGGSTAGSTVIEGTTYNLSKAGLYGTLYLNSTSGAFVYVPDDAAINALTAPTTESFTITVSDGTLSVSEPYTVILNGVNDAAIITGSANGAVIEAGGSANAASGAPTATGTLFDTDVDNPANTFSAVSSPTSSEKGYGTFTMTAAGVWTYTVDNTNPAVQALNVGGTLTDTFMVTTVDGTKQVVTVTIAGSNDAAVISGATTGSVIEAGTTTPGTPVASGTLTDIDVDNADNSFIAVASATASSKCYGKFTITATGEWTFTVDNANPAVQALNAGKTLTDTFTVKTVDGTAQVVTITIIGTNDAAVICGTTSGSVTEAGTTKPGSPIATGTLTDFDPDNAANTFSAVSSPTVSSHGYGSFTMTAAGLWTYTLDNTNPAVQALNVGCTLTDTFTVTTVDGTKQVVTITIDGANDAAVISGTTTGSVTEAGTGTPGMPVACGTLTDFDVDNQDNRFTAVHSPAATDKGYGTFVMTAAGVWTYMLDNSNCAVQALDFGQSLTDTFTVTTIDGTAQKVTIVIHGNSDADPNDFDNLALGHHVITVPPYVYGTPGSDTIAGGGDKCQIVYAGAGNDTVNGTGKDDILYSGSGNDTIKGNDGDDIIYGGSGNDTVNGNNGNDTITGGFGADRLTGSNGDDVFVYRSVADSNSSQFDTITDFASGADKIDLAALGGLTLLHLSSTSTPVPPHTIAWIYSSTSNETIVYVNSTSVARTAGDSALLEIHLQGVVSVHESDFIYQAAANAAVAAGEAIGLALESIAAEGNVLSAASAAMSSETSAASTDVSADATAGGLLRAADEGFKFHFDRDTGSTGFVRLAQLEETSKHAAVDDNGEGLVAPASGSPVELWHEHTATRAEDHFAFHHEPIRASTIAIGEPVVPFPASAISLAGLTVANAVATPQPTQLEGSHGNEADPLQSEHEPHAASHHAGFNDPHSVANALAAPQLVQTWGTPGGSPGQHPAPASISHTKDPGHGNSFRFKTEVAASNHSEPILPIEVGPAVPSTHGHGAGYAGLAAILEIAAAVLSPAEEHVHHANVHALGHGPHELLV